MALSSEMRRLQNKWTTGSSWPKFLDWIELNGIRGWNEQRIPFSFPIVAVVGENGSGKSTILQSAACSYQNEAEGETNWYPSEFFPETAWDQLRDVRIKFGYKQGSHHEDGSIRKPTTRWLGQPERPKRKVVYIDLSRLQPVGTRVGYARIAKNRHLEASSTAFTDAQIKRLSQIMGRDYDNAKMALSNLDENRKIPVLSKLGSHYSGFHQGSGETTIAELLMAELPKYGLILIDEIESSLHPRAQRRLMRDLAEVARLQECQIILSTHSPFILEELPLAARIYILETGNAKEVVTGVSPQFAMTKMDDENHPECEIYVEDRRAAVWVGEILSKHARDLFVRSVRIPFGAVNLGTSLGQIKAAGNFTRPTVIFLDGDQGENSGCHLLPGGDAPERVIFTFLAQQNWANLWVRIGRDIASLSDACALAMTLGDHHEWVNFAANQLMCGGDVLWQAMCSEWAELHQAADVQEVLDAIGDALAAPAPTPAT